MNKLVLGVAVGWLIIGLVPARAQFFPQTTPFVRPPLFPTSPGISPYGVTPYGGGLFGSPYGGGPFGSPYGTMPYGTTPFGSPYGYGASPYNAVPYGIPPFGGAPGSTVPAAPAASLNDPGVTGHPTRFFNYSRYFFTQGGASNAPLPGTRPILGANPTTTPTLVFGTAPPRGKANTGTGK
jgi:hypothetical protein